MFDAGQKVVCVDDKFAPAALRWLVQLPVEGKVYVVRDVKIGFSLVKRGKRKGGVRVLLVGLVNPEAKDGQEHGFNAERFRLLEEVKQRNLEIVEDNYVPMSPVFINNL